MVPQDSCVSKLAEFWGIYSYLMTEGRIWSEVLPFFLVSPFPNYSLAAMR